MIGDPKYQYDLELTNYTPIKERPIAYPPATEAWLDEELKQMIRTGRIEPVQPTDEAPMVTALVLVPQGQTDTAYRIC